MQETGELIVHKAQTEEQDARKAVNELQQALTCPNMAAVVFFCSISYDRDVLAQEMQSAFSCPVIGCTTAGEIGPAGYRDQTISAFSLQSERLRVFPNLLPDIAHCGLKEIEALATKTSEDVKAARADLPGAKPFGLLLIDGLSQKEEFVVGHLYHALAQVPIVGGSAGGGDAFAPTYVYHDGRFHNQAATFTLFVTSHPFEMFRTHHAVPLETKLVITKARPEERIVMEINGRPAADEYARCLGVAPEQLTSDVLAMHPLMLKLGGEYYIRSVMQVLDDGAVKFACAIDEGLVLTMGQCGDMVENLRSSLDELDARLNPQVIIGCECMYRKVEVLQKDIKDSMSRIMRHHNVVGFHTYGEQINAIHVNQTFTGIAIGAE